MMSSGFGRFVLVGLLNTAVGYSVILLLQVGIGAPPFIANAGGYLIGGLVSYALNRNFTFGSNRPHGQTLPRFSMVAAGCFALNIGVLTFGLQVLNLRPALAQALAVASYTVAFYWASRTIVFRK
jgi:putative flippase GtrA